MSRSPRREKWLADDSAGWANLGLWRAHGVAIDDYVGACRALALAVGDAAGLAPGMRVLDLGAGSGASTALFAARYGVDVCGVDPAAPREDVRLRRGTVAEVVPRLGRFDAVVAVDAAYHFGPLAAFAALAAAHLAPGGCLAFTTLAWSSASHRARMDLADRVGFALARIDPRAVVAVDTVAGTLGPAFARADVTALPDVLPGFAAHVARRSPALSRAARLSPAWARIALTARACRRIVANDRLRYVLVAATSVR